MTKQYIAGFFDADGSIYLARNRERETKTLYISLTNVDLENLKQMQSFLTFSKIKTALIKSPKQKDHHQQGYQIQCQGGNAERFMKLIELFSCNSKKKRRWEYYNENYKPLKKANGKYSETERCLIEQRALIFNDIV